MKAGMVLAVWLLAIGTSGAAADEQDYRQCLNCHQGIEKMDENHDFPCQDCHLMPLERQTPQDSHDNVRRFPAAPDSAAEFCGECHQKEIAQMQNSLHYTYGGIISQTRYLWGAQNKPEVLFSAAPHPQLNPLPAPLEEPEKVEDLVDDLLKRRCLSCHLGEIPPQTKGTFRGVGCTACHVYYGNEGVAMGGDPAVKGRTGYPVSHTFSKPIPVKQCLHCHYGPRVGAEYAGYFEHDYHHSYRTPWRDGSVPEPVYLMDHHRLIPDIHFQKGLICVDCHDQGDVMGRGDLAGWQQEAVGADCLDCHSQGAVDTHQRIRTRADGTTSYQDRFGRLHPLSVNPQSLPPHDIEEMARVHCTSCHAGWGFYDYGLSVLRDDRRDLSRWGAWRLQGDERTAQVYDTAGSFLGTDTRPGPWFTGWRFRRWEYMTLGVDAEDRIVPYRPHYQYRVSFVDKHGRAVIDNESPRRGDGSGPGRAFMPYSPHSVRPRGRACENCHGQVLAAGEGLGESETGDLSLIIPDPPVYPCLRLLNNSEKDRLLKKTERYRQIRSAVFRQELAR